MGSEGSTSAMIASLRNNKNLRLGRRKLFSRENRKGGSSNDINKPLTYKHLTEEQLIEVRQEISEKKKIDNLKKLTALIIAIALTGVLIYITINYFDFGSPIRR